MCVKILKLYRNTGIIANNSAQWVVPFDAAFWCARHSRARSGWEVHICLFPRIYFRSERPRLAILRFYAGCLGQIESYVRLLLGLNLALLLAVWRFETACKILCFAFFHVNAFQIHVIPQQYYGGNAVTFAKRSTKISSTPPQTCKARLLGQIKADCISVTLMPWRSASTVGHLVPSACVLSSDERCWLFCRWISGYGWSWSSSNFVASQAPERATAARRPSFLADTCVHSRGLSLFDSIGSWFLLILHLQNLVLQGWVWSLQSLDNLLSSGNFSQFAWTHSWLCTGT